jgi:hypothetical protein
MPAWVGTATGNKAVTRAVVGTATGNKEVTQIWVGTTGGNRLVWQSIGDLNVQAAATGPNNINVTWSDPEGGVDSYRIFLNDIYQATTTGLSYNRGSLAPSTTYTFRVDAFKGAQFMVGEAATATTQAVTTQQKVVTLSPNASASYKGDNAQRSTSYRYSGQYDGTWGLQKSLFTFPIPADLRNCVSVDKVEVSARNLHAWASGGVGQGLAVALANVTGTFPSASIHYFGSFGTAKGGWLNNTEWVDVTNYAAPYRGFVKEEFRVNGATGFSLYPSGTTQDYYSYWDAGMRVRFTYTVRTN